MARSTSKFATLLIAVSRISQGVARLLRVLVHLRKTAGGTVQAARSIFLLRQGVGSRSVKLCAAWQLVWSR